MRVRFDVEHLRIGAELVCGCGPASETCSACWIIIQRKIISLSPECVCVCPQRAQHIYKYHSGVRSLLPQNSMRVLSARQQIANLLLCARPFWHYSSKCVPTFKWQSHNKTRTDTTMLYATRIEIVRVRAMIGFLCVCVCETRPRVRFAAPLQSD